MDNQRSYLRDAFIAFANLSGHFMKLADYLYSPGAEPVMSTSSSSSPSPSSPSPSPSPSSSPPSPPQPPPPPITPTHPLKPSLKRTKTVRFTLPSADEVIIIPTEQVNSYDYAEVDEVEVYYLAEGRLLMVREGLVGERGWVVVD